MTTTTTATSGPCRGRSAAPVAPTGGACVERFRAAEAAQWDAFVDALRGRRD